MELQQVMQFERSRFHSSKTKISRTTIDVVNVVLSKFVVCSCSVLKFLLSTQYAVENIILSRKLKLVRQHDRWKALLRAEIGKAERLMEKENLKQNRRDDRRDIGKKNEIFKHGIKGIKKITGKYNTSKPLTEVKISCPCGLKWKWQAAFPDGIGREARALDWIQKCTANFRTHSLRTTQEGLEIQLETLTDMLPLLQATQNSPPEIGSRSLVYNLGP